MGGLFGGGGGNSNGATPNVKPASILNNATALTSGLVQDRAAAQEGSDRYNTKSANSDLNKQVVLDKVDQIEKQKLGS